MFFAYVKTNAQTSCVVTAQLISAFVFPTQKVQPPFFLKQGFFKKSLLDHLTAVDLSLARCTWETSQVLPAGGQVFFSRGFLFSLYSMIDSVQNG